MLSKHRKAQGYSTITSFGRTGIGRRAARLSDSINRAFQNDSSDHRTNGEAWLLTRIAPLRPTVVFDVGANVGTWTHEALGLFERARVYAFEPIPDTYEQLTQAMAARQEPRVVTSNSALTHEDIGSLPMWKGNHSTVASAVHRPSGAGEEVLVEAITGDTFCDRHQIERIDLLKIDTEGHDLDVLRGFTGMLRDGRVEVIQFEFTLFAVFARTWLGDFYSLLEPMGFSLGKLYPSWIDWKDYDAHDERFFRCNFVAVRRDTTAARQLGAPTA